MKRSWFIITFLALGVLLAFGYAQTRAQSLTMAPPGGEYKKVSSLVKLPDCKLGSAHLASTCWGHQSRKTLSMRPHVKSLSRQRRRDSIRRRFT